MPEVTNIINPIVLVNWIDSIELKLRQVHFSVKIFLALGLSNEFIIWVKVFVCRVGRFARWNGNTAQENQCT